MADTLAALGKTGADELTPTNRSRKQLLTRLKYSH